MKITFIAPHFGLSGGVRVIAIYANLLRKRGHEVMIVSQPSPRPAAPGGVRSLLFRKTGGVGDRSPYLKGLHVEHKVLETRRPVVDADVPDADVVIATWWETAFWGAALSPQKGRKFYFVQGHEVHKHLPWQVSRGSYFLPLKKIAVSKWLVAAMEREYGDRDVALVPNSVDLSQFHAEPRGRQPLPTVGLMYSPVSYKGLDIALKAVEKARKATPELKLVAFGIEEPDPSLPLPSGCEYWKNPTQDELRKIYASCDVWLFASRREGFGLPLLEAMACRTPVVATNAGAAADLIRDGVNGYVVDVEDSDALADRLLRTLNLPEADWKTMSDAALLVAREYTWDDAADLFEKVLLESLR